MSKRTKTNVKTMRCAGCFRSTNWEKCPNCGKPTVPVKDMHAKIMQETLEE